MSHYPLPRKIRRGLAAARRKDFQSDGQYVQEARDLLLKLDTDSKVAAEQSQRTDVRDLALSTIDILGDGISLFQSLATKLGIAPDAPADPATPDPMELAKRRFGL